MYCKKCGAKNKDDARFCAKCGCDMTQKIIAQDHKKQKKTEKKPKPVEKKPNQRKINKQSNFKECSICCNLCGSRNRCSIYIPTTKKGKTKQYNS